MVELAVIILLTLINGTFAMAELAIISSRTSRLELLADKGNHGARAALKLLKSPTSFLSAVQVGITVVGVLSGMFGASLLAPVIDRNLQEIGISISLPILLGIVVVIITLLNVIIGEIVPKQLALLRPERIACFLSPPMLLLSKMFGPIVSLLEWGTDRVLRALGSSSIRKENVTEDEVRALIKEGAASGVLDKSGEEIMHNVLELGDRTAESLMTPRQDIPTIDEKELTRISLPGLMHRYPGDFLYVRKQSVELPVGYLNLVSVAREALRHPTMSLLGQVKKAISAPSALSAAQLLERFRVEKAEAAYVLDEFGGFDGVVTINDVINSVLGDVSPLDDENDEEMKLKKDGSFEVEASIDIDDVFDSLGLEEEISEERRGYHSLGGFVMSQLGKVPKVGDSFVHHGYKFEVLSMNRQRINKILIKSTDKS